MTAAASDLTALPSRRPAPFIWAQRAIALIALALMLLAAPLWAQEAIVEDAGSGAEISDLSPEDEAALALGAFEASSGQADSSDSAATHTQGPRMRTPVVVELFTSQGCSSCPPADALLQRLAGRDDVLALSWHVDYWDYLGWADIFARPESTARQRAYSHALGGRGGLFTPQMIVGGAESPEQVRPGDITARIERLRRDDAALRVIRHREAGRAQMIELIPDATLQGPFVLLRISYLPKREVDIKRGENRGRRLSFHNIVADHAEIGSWPGTSPLRLRVTAPKSGGALPQDARHALLVQQLVKGQLPGRIVAAIPLD